MATLGSLSVILHIVAGITTLVAGPIAIFANRRYTKLHRIAGLSFFWAMNWVCITAVLGYFRHPNQVFYTFLLGISILVYAGILRGVRAIQFMKGRNLAAFDYAWAAALGGFSLWMLWQSWVASQFGADFGAIAILFIVFGLAAFKNAFDDFKRFRNFDLMPKMDWLRVHVSTMLGAFTASTTAFTVNTAHYLPWYIQWFGPTLLLLPLQIYWGRQLKSKTL